MSNLKKCRKVQRYKVREVVRGEKIKDALYFPQTCRYHHCSVKTKHDLSFILFYYNSILDPSISNVIQHVLHTFDELVSQKGNGKKNLIYYIGFNFKPREIYICILSLSLSFY